MSTILLVFIGMAMLIILAILLSALFFPIAEKILEEDEEKDKRR